MEWFKSHWFLITMLVLASVISFLWLYILNRRRIKAKWWECLILCITHTVFGVGTVKLWALLEVGFNTAIAGNMSMFGGIFIMPVFYYAYARIKRLPVGVVFDVFVVPLVATLLLARCNCLYAGCCIGQHIGDTEFRYPTREAEILYDSIFLIFVIPIILKDKKRGMMYPIYLISYGAVRFLLESFRESSATGFWHIAHTWSVVAFAIGLGILITITIVQKKRRAKDNGTQENA